MIATDSYERERIYNLIDTKLYDQYFSAVNFLWVKFRCDFFLITDLSQPGKCLSKLVRLILESGRIIW